MVQLMLDFETLDNTPTSVVISAGAVFFHRDRGTLVEREYFFDLRKQAKRTMGADTVKWWIAQSDEAKRKTFDREPQQPLVWFCHDLREAAVEAFGVLREPFDEKKIFVWGNGSDFDCSILTDIYRSEGVAPFWKFWNTRCFRTLDAVTGCKKLVKNAGVKHSAIDDARFQTECVLASMRR